MKHLSPGAKRALTRITASIMLVLIFITTIVTVSPDMALAWHSSVVVSNEFEATAQNSTDNPNVNPTPNPSGSTDPQETTPPPDGGAPPQEGNEGNSSNNSNNSNSSPNNSGNTLTPTGNTNNSNNSSNPNNSNNSTPSQEVPEGPFDPAEAPKTADFSDPTLFVAGLAVSIIFLRQSIFSRRKKEERKMRH